jgi:hypothetical protein
MRPFLSVGALLLSLAGCTRDEPLGPETGAPEAAPRKAIDSSDLKDTAVLPTLDTPIPSGKSAVWCAAFDLAWKELEKLAGGPVEIEKAPQETLRRLNEAPDPRSGLATGGFYAAAGFLRDGIVDTIREEMAARFPGHAVPDLSGGGAAGAVAYAFLRAGVKFKTPYPQMPAGFGFRIASGTWNVRGFGFRAYEPHDEAERKVVRGQAAVLYYEGPESFAFDPGADTKPYQLLLARMGRPGSLASAVSRLAEKEKQARLAGKLEDEDTLLVPDMDWALEHHFGELEGQNKLFRNKPLKGLFVETAMESIRFRLDRCGADLEAEARVSAKKAKRGFSGRRLELTGPFLLLARKRGSTQPILALWIEDFELLRPVQ